MKTILRFIKPYKCLCFFTLLVMVLDVAGGLLIPTITADMINVGVGGGDMQYLIRRGIHDHSDHQPWRSGRQLSERRSFRKNRKGYAKCAL